MSDTDALRFVKGHGTQNDFVVLADPAAELDLGVDGGCDLRPAARHRSGRSVARSPRGRLG